MVYDGKTVPFSRDEFDRMIPLSPKAYRETHEGELNEMRVAAGIPTKTIYEKDDPEIQALQAAAGLI